MDNSMELVSESRVHNKYLLGFKQNDNGTNRRSVTKKKRGVKNVTSSQIQTLYLRFLQFIFCHSGTVTIHWCSYPNRA
jgi:hypothetical protein